MRDFMERLGKAKLPEEQEELEAEYRQFKELQGRCERLLESQKMMERVREDKDEALKVMLQASKDLEAARRDEEKLAELISDDHIEADRRNMGMPDLFPKVKPGMIITKINRAETEDLEFDEIMRQLDKAKQPHALELRRYDFQQDVLSGEWASLQELRVLGRFVVDPRVGRFHFVESGRRGQTQDLEMALRRGEDVNATDVTSCTAFHHAAANGHLECMELLLHYGANIEHRDNNMETPLLQAARRGNMEVVDWLLAKNASLDAKDRMHRTAVFHAILGRNVELVEKLIQLRTSLSVTDKVWGWTPLHFAAYVNSAEMVEMLLSRRASPYLKSSQGWTPLGCAEVNQAHECLQLLTEFVFAEPAQIVLPGKPDCPWPANVWVGCHRAAHVRWATDRKFGAILSIYEPGQRDPQHNWLSTLDPSEDPADDINWLAVEVDTDDEDPTLGSWERLLPHLPKMLGFLNLAMKQNRDVLVHCSNGVSTSTAVVALYIMVKRRMRFTVATAHLETQRREVKLSRSMQRGLATLQEELDRRKLDRLDHRLRNSSVLSIGF
mmetsp:Transcript_5905/g.9917  ORF Transcript_5905/g.9917 Transcript_5905/m.9917 type:complete len:554 (-) Transcript_5905:190-1851(-)